MAEAATKALQRSRATLAYGTALLAELRPFRGLFLFVGAYLAMVAGVAVKTAAPGGFALLLYFPRGLALTASGIFVSVLGRSLWIASRSGGHAPLQHAAAAFRALPTPRNVAGLLLFSVMMIFFSGFTSLKNLLPNVAAFGSDRWLATLDAALHGGVDPWRLLDPLLGTQPATRVIEILYAPGWGAMLFGSLAAITLMPSLAPVRLRFCYTFVLCWAVLGSLLAGLFLSGGPAFFGDLTGDAERFAPLLRHLSLGEGAAHSAYAYQRMLWLAYEAKQIGFGTGISAFPSMHLSMATLVALVAFRIDRRFGAAMVVFAAILLLGSVHLAWHYAIDGYFSILATIVLWRCVGLALNRSTLRHGAPAPAGEALDGVLLRTDRPGGSR